jgi:hypothetical protein
VTRLLVAAPRPRTRPTRDACRVGTETKRPHFVPACYLRAWADPAGQVVVRRRGAAKVFTPNTLNVAVDAGLYGRGTAGDSREQLFGQLEQMWPALLEGLTSRGGALQGHDAGRLNTAWVPTAT